MRKYTFTFAEAITYEVDIDADSEVDALDIIDKMSDAKLRKKIVGRTEMETTKTVKGDFLKVVAKEKAKK